MAGRLPNGWFAREDVEFYRHVYQDLVPENGHTAEVGVYKGRSLMSVADIIKAKNIQVTAVDNFSHEMQREFLKTRDDFGLSELVALLRGDSVACSAFVPDASLDFVFIDADHSYEAVKADIATWKPKLKPTGHMGGHDYFLERGVVKAVNEAFPGAKIAPASSCWLVQLNDESQKNVILGIGVPHYMAGFVGGASLLKLSQSKRLKGVSMFETSQSILTSAFNSAWCWALNSRKYGLTHFLLMHADVKPMDMAWFDILLAEMEKANADVINPIIPIKDGRGLTSTALDTNRWHPVRITQKQAKEMPVTWTSPGLLNNDGLLLCNMQAEWVTKTWPEKAEEGYFSPHCFTIHDQLVFEGGDWKPACEPEDWNMSRQMKALGARIWATRAVTVEHFGQQVFSSERAWGWQHDEQNACEAEFTITDTEGNQAVMTWDDPPEKGNGLDHASDEAGKEVAA